MTVAIKDVPMWLVLDRKIGHALAQTRSGWHLTICGTYTPNGERTEAAPMRVCSKCRDALKKIALSPHEGADS